MDLYQNYRCRREHEACENCTGVCGLEMIKNSDQCSVTVNDDNGRSPRLPLCFTCCVRKKCLDACRFYHDDRCRMERLALICMVKKDTGHNSSISIMSDT